MAEYVDTSFDEGPVEEQRPRVGPWKPFRAEELDPALIRKLGVAQRLSAFAARHERGLALVKPTLGRLAEATPVKVSATSETRTRQLNEKVDEWLAQRVPQALLRDLYRPVTYYFLGIYDIVRQPPIDFGGREAAKLFREDRWHRRLPFRRESLAMLDEERRRHRDFTDHEWTKDPPKGIGYVRDVVQDTYERL